MYEHQSWRKCRGLIFREYLKYCVPPLFQSVFNLTKGRGYFKYFFCFGNAYSIIPRSSRFLETVSEFL